MPTLPSLSASRPLRLTTVTAMYVAQGIQIGLIITAFPAYLAAQGVAPAVIGGWVSVSVLPWTLKLVYAPVMERYTVLAMGRRRPWMLAGTTGGALGYAAMALVPDPLAHLGLLTAMMVAGSLFLALQDIATDALVVDVVPLDEQGRANGLMWGGKVLGTAATATVASWLFGRVGVSATFALAGGATLAFVLLPLLLRERPGERLLPWTAGKASAVAEALQPDGWGEIGRGLRRVVVFPAVLLAAALGFVLQLSEGLFDAYGPVFTVQHLGWADAAFSNAMAVAKLVGGVVGMVGGGLLVRRLGWTGAVGGALLTLAAVGVGMGLAPALWGTALVVQGYLLLAVTAQTLATIAFFATCMALCWRPVAAVQFALFMAVANVGYISGSGAMGLLVATLSPAQVFFALAAVPIAGATLLLRLDVAAHVARLAALDRAYVPDVLDAMPEPSRPPAPLEPAEVL
ncbi:MFS transporter [Rubrivirga marina]|uniref:Major facilitator superfamily (MFS) profile domain-containing protein n=1 Tax=Rubrivirga marina TaxID=1196024 RepID=A0A271IW82_9BACT|nr:MFS transporter [Rubrivirga marina]PAP75452.1 hypothetical protein BSZ37_02825 [Rubrivirga marina]